MNCINCNNINNPCYRCPCLSVCNSIRIDELEEELNNLILKNGSTVLMGSTPPENTLGKNHDIYFCYYPSTIWEKIDGEWIKRGNLLCNFDGGVF